MLIDLNCFLRWAMWPMGLLFRKKSINFENIVLVLVEKACRHVLQCASWITHIFHWHMTMSLRLSIQFNKHTWTGLYCMRMPLPHSAASGNSFGWSKLPEGATWEADSCHQGWCSPPSFYIYLYMHCYVYWFWCC